MILSNLNTNHKIMIGVSAITLLAIIYKYVQNMFNPKQNMIEGSTDAGQMSFAERYGTRTNQNSGLLGQSAADILANFGEHTSKNNLLLQGIYDELGEFNHIYQEKLFESLVPTQIKKTIIHLSSIDHDDTYGEQAGAHKFKLNGKAGLNIFKNVINMKLLGAQMPYVPYNIYEEKLDGFPANELYFNASTVKVIPGYYTIYSLISTINAQMSGQSIQGNFSFDNITKLVKLNGNTNNISASGILYKKLGFGTDNLTSSASYIADLSIHYIDISYGNIHPKSATLTNNDGNILKRIPLNGQPGDIIYYDAPHSDYLSQELFKPDTNSNISEIEIIMNRHDKTRYNLMGLHFDLKLEITELVEPTLLTEIESHMRRDKIRFFEKDSGSELSGSVEGANSETGSELSGPVEGANSGTGTINFQTNMDLNISDNFYGGN
mgnify:CR=1 FL=1